MKSKNNNTVFNISFLLFTIYGFYLYVHIFIFILPMLNLYIIYLIYLFISIQQFFNFNYSIYHTLPNLALKTEKFNMNLFF